MKLIRKGILLVLAVCTLLILTSCDLSQIMGMLGEGGDILSGEHTCTWGSWEVVDEADCTVDGLEVRECYFCDEKEERVIKATGHTPQIQPKIAPTCKDYGYTEGKKCASCDAVLVPVQRIDKLPHTPKTLPATDTKTEGKQCSVCYEILVKQEWIFASEFESPDSYDGDHAYNYLQNMPNGEALAALYKRIDEVADAYHLGDISAELDGGDYVVAKIMYSDLGLTLSEALTVWTSYSYDHPLYYWYSKSVKYTDSKTDGKIYLISYPEYVNTDERERINSELYAKAEEYVTFLSAETSVYHITLLLHDLIIESVSYAYESDGKTPEDAVWAHNVLGVMTYGSGVCESYAKSFELLLNYCGINNVYVTGKSRGESHAWNLVEVSEDEWYWYDLTWDDTPTWLLGTSYNYFCVNDNDNTNWYDAQASFDFDKVTFVENHTVTAPDLLGINYLYSLPERAENSIDGELLLRDSFTVGGLTYAIVGAGEVQLVYADTAGELVIPESVSYLGESYTVVSVGRFDEDGFFFEADKISEAEITSVSVPASVRYIYSGAFNFKTLEKITVDSKNTVYASQDGILYNKEFTSILWIPKSISGEVSIHPKAENFDKFFFNSRSLTEVTLGKNVTALHNNAFYYCIGLTDIYYAGTVDEWTKITKGADWSTGSEFVVHCSNGDINVN